VKAEVTWWGNDEAPRVQAAGQEDSERENRRNDTLRLCRDPGG
jgi:hypothetical protein